MSFLEAMKSIIFNERGEIGEQDSGDSSDAVESSDESSSDESADDSMEASDEDSSDDEVSEDSDDSEEGIEVQAETEEELEEEIQQAIEEGASEKEVQEMLRKYVLKVDGKEYVREIDINNEEEMQKQLQMALKGQKTMQELAEIKKLYSSELARLQKDPFRVLKELDPSFDPLEVSAQYIDQLMKENEKSPEQKAREAELAELNELRAEKIKLQEERENAAREKEMNEVMAQMESEILEALEADTEIVGDKQTVALIAQEMLWAAEKGIDIDAKTALNGVKESYRKQLNSFANKFKDPKAIQNYMGDDLKNLLRQERMQKAQNQVKNLNSASPAPKSAPKPKESKKISLEDIIAGRVNM